MTEDDAEAPVFSDQPWTFDEVLLDPAGPLRDELASDDPARLDAIRAELERGFRMMAGVTKGVSIFGSARASRCTRA